MAGPTRQPPAALKTRLLRDSRTFPFVQAMRLLRLLVRNEAGVPLSERELGRRIRVRPELTLAFAQSDLTSIEESGPAPTRFLLTVTFLGLYGTSSPLPTFYTEDLLQEWRDGQSLSRDFIDLINNSLYHLFFQIWAKYQLPYNVYEAKNPEFIEHLYALGGMAEPSWRRNTPDPFQALRYLGLLTQFPRSAAGLQALIRDHFGTDLVRVEQCVAGESPIPLEQRCHLGQAGCRLAEDAMLGERIAERQSRFQVVVGPLTGASFHGLLPDQKAFSRLAHLIRFYLDQPLAWNLVLLVRQSQIHGLQLGTPEWSQLGWNSWIFSQKPTRKKIFTVILPGADPWPINANA